MNMQGFLYESCSVLLSAGAKFNFTTTESRKVRDKALSTELCIGESH
jgi:hypothetical protein